MISPWLSAAPKPNVIPGNEQKSGGFTNEIRWNSWIHEEKTWAMAGSNAGNTPIQETLEIIGYFYVSKVV